MRHEAACYKVQKNLKKFEKSVDKSWMIWYYSKALVRSAAQLNNWAKKLKKVEKRC